MFFEPLRQFLVGRSDSAHRLPGVRLSKISTSAEASSARARKLRASNRISAHFCRVSKADLTTSRKFKNWDCPHIASLRF